MEADQVWEFMVRNHEIEATANGKNICLSAKLLTDLDDFSTTTIPWDGFFDFIEENEILSWEKEDIQFMAQLFHKYADICDNAIIEIENNEQGR